MGGTMTFAVNQDGFALGMLAVIALVGLVAAALGALVATWPNGWLGRRNDRYVLRALANWGALDARDADQAEVVRLARHFTRLNGWAVAGGGLGAALGAVLTGALALALTGALSGVIGDLSTLFITIFYQGFMLGVTAGYLAATRAVTGETGAVWAGLRPRRVSDYRAGWLAWGTWALALLAIAPLAAVVALRLPLRLDIGSGPVVEQAGPWALTIAVWALAIPALAALACHWIVASPRTLSARDPRMARAADEMRRALAINLALGVTWITCGLTLMTVSEVTALTLSQAFAPVGIAVDLLFLAGLLANLFGLGLNMLHGRLGGRVTGGRVTLGAMLDASAVAHGGSDARS